MPQKKWLLDEHCSCKPQIKQPHLRSTLTTQKIRGHLIDWEQGAAHRCMDLIVNQNRPKPVAVAHVVSFFLLAVRCNAHHSLFFYRMYIKLIVHHLTVKSVTMNLHVLSNILIEHPCMALAPSRILSLLQPPHQLGPPECLPVHVHDMKMHCRYVQAMDEAHNARVATSQDKAGARVHVHMLCFLMI